jgi:hypothetical protein
MASKFTVAFIGAIVIVVSAVILIYKSLSFPTQCIPQRASVHDISPTQRHKVGTLETTSLMTSITTSTLPSSGFAFPSSLTTASTSGASFQTDSNTYPYLSSIITFRTGSTLRLSSGLASSTDSIPRSTSSVTTKFSSTSPSSSKVTPSPTSGVHSSSQDTSPRISTADPFSLLISPSVTHYSSERISVLNETSEITSTAQSRPTAGTGLVNSRDEETSTTLGPRTVLSSLKDLEVKFDSRVTLSIDLPEEETEDHKLVSDLQPRTSETDAATQSTDMSSIHPRITLPITELRNIINTPKRNCGSGEKKDMFGQCRPIW